MTTLQDEAAVKAEQRYPHAVDRHSPYALRQEGYTAGYVTGAARQLSSPNDVQVVCAAEHLDDLLLDLNDRGHDAVALIVDARGVAALACLNEIGGDEVEPVVVLGGDDLPTVSGIERDQRTEWLTYPVRVLHLPGEQKAALVERGEPEVTTAAELDALPADTVVVDRFGVPRTKRLADSCLPAGWTHAGRETLSSHQLADGQPLRVVFVPSMQVRRG
ncbi:hypothetical protein [Cellulosimicrobium sp. NPDC057127]|uniref:hypothetical protein n=1 Tax=Cellulosimicrobium sp. NPDC057127 TaxID=3346026 RepID=UPI003634E7D5